MDTEAVLSHLLAQERSLSRRRARLQDRIDFVRGGGSGTGGANASAEQLETLLKMEKELSDRRRLLHSQIDSLRQHAFVDPSALAGAGDARSGGDGVTRTIC
jgi:hypothetical protein